MDSHPGATDNRPPSGNREGAVKLGYFHNGYFPPIEFEEFVRWGAANGYQAIDVPLFEPNVRAICDRHGLEPTSTVGMVCQPIATDPGQRAEEAAQARRALDYAAAEHIPNVWLGHEMAPGLGFDAVRRAAFLVRELLDEFGLVGWPRTSGGRGMHIVVRIVPTAGFVEVRDAALALARAAERRAPDLITSAWRKKDRGRRVFVDYNQNARDRTLASAYSVRPDPEARVAAPLRWDEVAGAEPGDFTLATMAQRWRTAGDVEAALEDRACSPAALLDLARRDGAAGTADAPWPPHHPRPR